jgi:hypothetical protein
LAADPESAAGTRKEWTFARLAYGSQYGRSMWDVDFPCAEEHLSTAITRLTRVEVRPGGRVVEPASEELFDYPWLHAVEVHSWSFSPPEAANMREYLPHWRGIRDDKGRWMVVISHNIDYGEGWEQADNPRYPEEFTGQAYEVAIDYLVYAMTH